MGEIIVDKGNKRELVKVACDFNDTGYYTTYRDAMKEGDVEYGAASPFPAPSPKEDPPKADEVVSNKRRSK